MAGHPRVLRLAGGSLEAKKGQGGGPSGCTPPSKEDSIEEFTRAQKEVHCRAPAPMLWQFKLQAEAAELALESLDPSL